MCIIRYLGYVPTKRGSSKHQDEKVPLCLFTSACSIYFCEAKKYARHELREVNSRKFVRTYVFGISLGIWIVTLC